MDILTQLQADVNAPSDEPDWGDRIPFLGETSPQEYDANMEAGDPAPQPGDVVQHLVSKRTYQVLRVKENGRLVLWTHGWPRIRNADPSRWRVLPRLELGHAA